MSAEPGRPGSRTCLSCCPVPQRSASRRWSGVCASAFRTCTSAFRSPRVHRGRARSTASTTTSSARARFQQLIDQGALLEWAEIHGGLHRSGTLAEPVRDATAAGLPVLIEVDLAGARAVKKAMPEADHRLSGATELGGPGSPAGRPRYRDTRGDTAPAGHRAHRIGRPGRLRRGRGEQAIRVCVRRIGILAGGKLRRAPLKPAQ